MKRCKTIISMMLLLGCTIFLWGCGADKEKIAEAEQWVTYQGILVGESTIDDVKAVFGEPDKFTEFEDGNMFYYDSIHHRMSFKKGICTGIGVGDDDTFALWDDIRVGDSFDKVLEQCPVPTEEHKYKVSEFPGVVDGKIKEMKADLYIFYKDEEFTEIFDKEWYLLLPDERIVNVSVDKDNTIIDFVISAEVK